MRLSVHRLPNLVVLILTTLFLVGTPLAAQADTKVAVVNMDRAVSECKQGKKALAQLKLKVQKLETELKTEEANIKKLQGDLENTAMLLKPEARFSKEQEFQRRLRRFQERRRDANQELLVSRREAMSPIVRNMVKMIQDLGAKGKYTLITESKAAIYYPTSVDITAQVVAAFDKAYP